MTEKPKTKMETWYSAMFLLANCDQAAIIRTFFGPVYLVYFMQASEKSLVEKQCRWIEGYREWLKAYEREENDQKSDTEMIQARIRALGNYFCEQIEREYGLEAGRFLGKNRNVEQFPERFLYAVFPEQDIGIFWDLTEHFKELIKFIFAGYEEQLFKALSRVRKLNRETSFYRVPEIPFRNNDDFLEKCELLAYLLCGICLLSAAKRVEERRKNGLSGNYRSVLKRAKDMLEIPEYEESPVRENGILIETKDFLALLSAALDAHDDKLLEACYKICQKIGAFLYLSEDDCSLAYDFLDRLSYYKQVLPVELTSQDRPDFNAVVRELKMMIDLESYWKEVLEAQEGIA